MFPRRHVAGRKTLVFLVLSLLFSQLALATYLCPAQTPRPDMATTMAAGVPCDEIDQAQPTLCRQHAADAGQVMQAAQVVSPSLPALLQVLWMPVAPFAEAVVVPRAFAPEARPPPDPIFLATLRLRV